MHRRGETRGGPSDAIGNPSGFDRASLKGQTGIRSSGDLDGSFPSLPDGNVLVAGRPLRNGGGSRFACFEGRSSRYPQRGRLGRGQWRVSTSGSVETDEADDDGDEDGGGFDACHGAKTRGWRLHDASKTPGGAQEEPGGTDACPGRSGAARGHGDVHVGRRRGRDRRSRRADHEERGSDRTPRGRHGSHPEDAEPGTRRFARPIRVRLLHYPPHRPGESRHVESTMAMQALQPSIKEIQTKYKNDQERLQVETARLYKEAGVNPLAGCLPTLATIPVWIGLYRALQNAAAEGVLTEGFFWIPSLAGPTSIAKQTAGAGMAWLFPLQDGAPPVGWHDAVAYLVLPVLLIISQYVSQKIISPQQSADPSQKQANAILQFLPLMIGYFSLNVPSGLTLYWFTNNILTTAQQVFLRRTAPAPAIPSSAPIRKSVPAASSTKASRKAERAKKANATSTAFLSGNGSAEKEVGKSDFFGGDSFSEVRELPAAVKDQDHEDEGVSVPDGPPAKESAGESGSTSAASERQSKQQLSRKARKKNKKRA
eukprot:scaffold285_cov330-Pavlova_lutheri.AAC.88